MEKELAKFGLNKTVANSIFEGNFNPTVDLVYFKELLHERLTDEEILELRLMPAMYLDKLAPFGLETVTAWVKNDTTFAWLSIKDPAALKLELEKPLYIEQLKKIALGEYDDDMPDPRMITVQLRALETLLKLTDKTSSARKQKASISDSEYDPSKILKALPKQYAKLSEFELEIAKKQVQDMVSGKASASRVDSGEVDSGDLATTIVEKPEKGIRNLENFGLKLPPKNPDKKG